MSPTNSPGAGNAREQWKAALTSGPGCLSIEQLAEPSLDRDQQSHVDTCLHCQTERALALVFESAEPLPDEGAAVQWIAREAKRRVFPEQPAADSPRRWFRLPAWATSLAALAAVILGATLLFREPGSMPGPVEPDPIYRTASVELTAPIGDVSVIPASFVWRAASDAARYELIVMEVDGTELWRATTTLTNVAIPDVVRAAAKPARTLRWTVTALNASGNPVTQSALGTFRLRS